MNQDRIQIAESIQKIERFPFGYPKRVIVADPKWQAFFDWQLGLCERRAAELRGEPSLFL